MKTADKLHSLIWGDITHRFTDVPMAPKDADDLSNSIYGRIETALTEHDNEIKDLIDEEIKNNNAYVAKAMTELKNKLGL